MDVEKAMANMIANLKQNTGKTLEEWKEVFKTHEGQKHGEMVKHLKDTYGIGHGFANTIVLKTRGADAGSASNDEELITKQYSGKEELKPIYDQLVKTINSLGENIIYSPKNAYVSVKCKKQFAIIQPSTKTRLDLGLNIKDFNPIGKLEKAGSFNAMCTHRIRLEKLSDIDEDVVNWLKKAYEGAC